MTQRVIWKYPLKVADQQYVAMPSGAVPLSVQVQGADTPCVWAMVDPTQPPEHVDIRIHGTGHPFDAAQCHFLGTFQLYGGQLVFHAFHRWSGQGRPAAQPSEEPHA